MFSLMLSIVRASCRVDLKSKSHVEKWDVDRSWWRALWIISDLRDYASRLVQMIGTSRNYGTPTIKLKMIFLLIKVHLMKEESYPVCKAHKFSRSAVWVLKISSPACLSRPSVPFASMERQVGCSHEESGKTGGPFETSITGTCHFVDVTTASEFVITLPLSSLSPSTPTSFRSLAANHQNLRIST